MRSRALTEEHARDSFENLLFSVSRLRELRGSYPQNITVKPLLLSNLNITELSFKKILMDALVRYGVRS